MEILRQLIRYVPPVHVLEVTIGIHSTLIKTGKNCGIASTLSQQWPHEDIHNAGQLEQFSLRELAEFSLSGNQLEASVGIAAINCAFSARINRYHTINAKTILLERGKGKIVGIIGHFPFLEMQRDQFKECYIFEKRPRTGDLLESDIPEYLPKVDVAAITGTSLTNHTFERIMNHLPKKSYKMILGPSTPLAPPLFKVGIHTLSGTLVEDYEQVKKHVLQGAPTRQLQGVKYVTLFKEDFA
ncbi:MAG: DUF364 domain-containing protein [Candidatus Marinimicrobia bacterium]|nr:DUF364 domain-containing protein [Candidatus Neomarinimicrobiota bacterium]